MSTSLEGRIDIRLTQFEGVTRGVAIRSSRPRLAQKLMAGCTPELAADRAGLIFSLCGKAQRAAAEAAGEAARGLQPDVPVSTEREQRVLIELAQEHAWHLLLNWPQQSGRAADMTALLALRQNAASPHFDAALDTLLHAVLLGEPAGDWLEHSQTGFDNWRLRGDTPTAAAFGAWEQRDHGISRSVLLPSLQQLSAAQCEALARNALANEAFCGQPEWAGSPAETGAIARMQTHPLLTDWIARRGRGAGARLLARLLELAQLPQRLRTGGDAVVAAYSLGDNIGMSAVETSRGLLIHALRLEAGKVADYRIIAPTEWNFHPAGPLVQALADLTGSNDVSMRAQGICQSLDPCVAFSVEVCDA